MAQFLNANGAISTLAGSISDTATTANLAVGTGALFPSPGAGQYFTGTFISADNPLIREIVWVTAISGDTITMVRGQEGTDQIGWTAGDGFQQRWTAGQAQALVQLPALQAQQPNYSADTGIANAYVVGLNPALSSPIEGMPIRIKVSNTNTGASTVNPGSGVAPLVRRDGSAFIGGEWKAGSIVEFYWNGAGSYQWDGLAPATDAAAAAGTDEGSAITPAQLGAASALPPGFMAPAYVLSAPAGWLLCYGQAVPRSTYANLFAAITAASVVTISIASPAIVNWAAHGLIAGDIVSFETTGALPTGLSTATNYYVTDPTLNTFKVAATPGGAAINTSGSQSGVQTARHNPAGCGNGTTTFNVPDGRGRVFAGADAMGGAAAGVLGSGPTGGMTAPAVVGATGGQQSHVQTVAELAAHTHAVPGQLVTPGPLNSGTGTTSVNLINNGTSDSTGGSTAFNVVQPSFVGNWLIKT